jgi:hypothetical protein
MSEPEGVALIELLHYFLSAEYGEGEEEDENLMALTPKWRRLFSQLGLRIGSCSPFTGLSHVVYCNLVLPMGLLGTLAKDNLSWKELAIQRTAASFPSSLKTVTPPIGSYKYQRV